MWALLIAIVVIGLALVVVGAARRELLAKSQSAPSPCCAPCRNACPASPTSSTS